MQAKQPGPILCPPHKADRTNVVMSRSPLCGVVPYGTESRPRFYPPACKPYGLEAEPEAHMKELCTGGLGFIFLAVSALSVGACILVGLMIGCQYEKS